MLPGSPLCGQAQYPQPEFGSGQQNHGRSVEWGSRPCEFWSSPSYQSTVTAYSTALGQSPGTKPQCRHVWIQVNKDQCYLQTLILQLHTMGKSAVSYKTWCVHLFILHVQYIKMATFLPWSQDCVQYIENHVTCWAVWSEIAEIHHVCCYG